MWGFCWVESVALNESVPLKCCHCQDTISSFLPPWRVHVHRSWKRCQQRLSPPRFLYLRGGPEPKFPIFQVHAWTTRLATVFCWVYPPCVPCSSSWKKWAALFQMKTNHLLFRSEFFVRPVFTFWSLSHLIIKLINTITARNSLGLHYAFQ